MNPKLSICALAVLASMSIVGGACGGDDDETTTPLPTTTAAGATGPTGPTGEQGASGTVTADDVLTCLDEAGLDASTSDTEFLGLEADYERVDIAQGDLDTAATMAIFTSAEDAESELSTAEVALGVADVQQSGNVDWGIDAAAEFSPDEQKAIEDCLPS
jgi:hypothetical protein